MPSLQVWCEKVIRLKAGSATKFTLRQLVTKILRRTFSTRKKLNWQKAIQILIGMSFKREPQHLARDLYCLPLAVPAKQLQLGNGQRHKRESVLSAESFFSIRRAAQLPKASAIM